MSWCVKIICPLTFLKRECSLCIFFFKCYTACLETGDICAARNGFLLNLVFKNLTPFQTPLKNAFRLLFWFFLASDPMTQNQELIRTPSWFRGSWEGYVVQRCGLLLGLAGHWDKVNGVCGTDPQSLQVAATQSAPTSEGKPPKSPSFRRQAKSCPTVLRKSSSSSNGTSRSKPLPNTIKNFFQVCDFLLF